VPKLRDARPSPPKAPAPAAPPTSWSDDEATLSPQHGSQAKSKKLGAKAAKKKRQKERKKRRNKQKADEKKAQQERNDKADKGVS